MDRFQVTRFCFMRRSSLPSATASTPPHASALPLANTPRAKPTRAVPTRVPADLDVPGPPYTGGAAKELARATNEALQ
jgi:hypothetical protein